MPNNFFHFKQFTIRQDKCAFKVGTDAVLLGAWTDIDDAKYILDIGTGTGIIALMLAQKSNAEIFAIEPDKESFLQASDNIRNSKWKERIRIENTDIQNYYPINLKFDIIVSNPPYFADSLKNPNSRKALSRHNDTLKNRELLDGISRLLSPGGRFQVIMPYAEGNVLIAEASGHGLYCNSILKIRPLPTSEIRRLILSFSFTRNNVKESFLTIEHGKRHDFTGEYRNLTRDFYL